MGVTKPEILLTADPALTLRPAGDDVVDSVLLRAGIPPRGRYLCFALRQWPGFAEKAPLFGQAARYAYETYGLTPVFVSVEKGPDSAANRTAAWGLEDIPHYFLDDAGNAGSIIGALARMEAVVSMRLHALIFAAGRWIHCRVPSPGGGQPRRPGPPGWRPGLPPGPPWPSDSPPSGRSGP